jgi:hypothetical protein
MLKKYRCNFEELGALEIHNGHARNYGLYIAVSAKMTDLLQGVLAGSIKSK